MSKDARILGRQQQKVAAATVASVCIVVGCSPKMTMTTRLRAIDLMAKECCSPLLLLVDSAVVAITAAAVVCARNEM